MKRLEVVVQEAVARSGDEWRMRLSVGLEAGLGLLAADPELARRLLVEGPAAGGDLRLEYEHALTHLAEALQGDPDGGEISVEQARLLAGGLVSHLAGRVLAGEAERLRDDHDLLLKYLLETR